MTIIFLSDLTWKNFFDPDSPPPTTLCATYGVTNSFSVAARGVTNVPIPIGDMDLSTNPLVNLYGIDVAASAPVSVYAVNYALEATAAFTALPTPMLGTNYCVMSRQAYLGESASEFTILAIASNTTVSITPSASAALSGFFGVTNITTNLQPGQTYQLMSGSPGRRSDRDVYCFRPTDSRVCRRKYSLRARWVDGGWKPADAGANSSG